MREMTGVALANYSSWIRLSVQCRRELPGSSLTIRFIVSPGGRPDFVQSEGVHICPGK